MVNYENQYSTGVSGNAPQKNDPPDFTDSDADMPLTSALKARLTAHLLTHLSLPLYLLP